MARSDVNQVTVSGRLVRDPELQDVGKTKVCRFDIASNEVWGSSDKDQHVNFLRCEAWGKRGEVIAQYKHKGDGLLITGSLRQDRWTKGDAKRSMLKIRASHVQFLQSKRTEAAPAAPDPVAGAGDADEGDSDE